MIERHRANAGRPVAFRRLSTIIAVLAAVASVPLRSQAPTPHHLSADSARFLLDGAPYQIIAGSIHYTRVPREDWRDRLRKARAMGLNTVTTYVFWNAHEPRPGVYDFSGQEDLAEYIRIAGEVGLHVLLRPGPYICSEWELGGYPAWLLADSTVVLRSTDPRFTRPAERWLDTLGRVLAPLLASNGGPIIGVQVENEYGSFDHDSTYLAWQLAALRHAGFGSELLYTADGPGQLPNGTIPGIPAVVNIGPGDVDSGFAHLIRFRPNGPRMTGEYWDGWFDQWGHAHARDHAAEQVADLDTMLTRGYSLNLYMFHGGTSFGFMNGANGSGHDYNPQTTSYDYNAPLDESGRPTPKYFAFRRVIARHTGVEPPPVPDTPPPIAVAPFPLTRVASLDDLLRHPIASAGPRTMEAIGQSTGYIDYRTTVPAPGGGRGAGGGILRLAAVRDYVQVYINGELSGTLDRRHEQDSMVIAAAPGATLDLLIENGGRINFTKALRHETKGLTGPVTLDGTPLVDWQIFPLPMDSAPAFARTHRPTSATGPGVYRGTFTVDRPGDAFLDTRGWGKGAVWVNGHALGRFWDIGPQQTLYLPGVWLRRGANTIVVFDLMVPERRTMSALTRPVLDQLQ